MLLSIRVEAEFAEARTEALTTTISSLWRSDRGEFSHTIILIFMIARLARVWLNASMIVNACLIIL